MICRVVYSSPVQANSPPPPLPETDLTSVALALLGRISRLSRRFQAIVGPELEGQLGLQLKELMVLGAIAKGHTHPGQISSRLGLPPPTTSRLLEGLTEAGYLHRETVPGDLRRFRMQLTEEGARLRTLAHQVAGEALGHELELVPVPQLAVAIEQLSLLELSLGITEDQ